MTTTRKTPFKCPNCRIEFTTHVVTSSNSFGRRSTDLWQQARGVQPILYELHTCSKCGYSGYEGDFDKLVLMGKPKRQIEVELTPTYLAEFPPADSRRYEYAAWIGSWRGLSQVAIGQLYHTAAWCCRLEDNPPEEERYMERAAARFEAAILDARVARMEIALHTYLVAELSRRLGRSERSNEWYIRAAKAQRAFGGPQFIADLARKQRTDPSDWVE
jgi:uncharacterized protein